MSAKKWEAEGDKIMADTVANLNGGGGFFSSFFGGSESSKKESARGGYEAAANKFKLAKSWYKASVALEKAAAIMTESGDIVEAGSAYANAGSFLFKCDDIKGGVRLLQMAVKVYQDTDKLDKAGKYEKLIGEKLEARTDVDDSKKAAQAHFERAYDLFSADETYKLSAIGCLEKIANIVSERREYKKAFKWWEKMIDLCAEDARLNMRMTKAIMNAFYCAITQKDSVLTSEKIETWADKNVRFARSSELTFCKDINGAFEDADYKALSTAFAKWDRFNKLTDWQVSCIKVVFDEIKPATASEEDASSSAAATVVPPPAPSATTTAATAGGTNATVAADSPSSGWPVMSDDEDEDDSSLL